MFDEDELSTIIETFQERGVIASIDAPIKSGKEASVYRCTAGSAVADAREVALKVYRPREERSFQGDAFYREGSLLYRIGGGNTRAARAAKAGSRFGRVVLEGTWASHEWETLRRLHAAGVPVPRPIDASGSALVLELIATAGGEVAPPLHQVRLGAEEASALFAALVRDVERMLSLHVIHGDLSPYNVLVQEGRHRIIDLPQAVDPRFHGSAFAILARDIEALARHCRRFGPVPDTTALAIDMWRRFERGEIG